MNKKSLKKIKRIFFIILGSFIMALGSYFFLFSANIASGGVGGLSIVLHNVYPHIRTGYMITSFNILLFIIGLVVLGREFGVYTLIGTVSYSLSILLLEQISQSPKLLINDALINILVGSAFTGAGLAIVFNQNASTGGTDIVAKIIDKHTSIGMGTAIVFADGLVIIFAAFVLGIEKAIYGVVAVSATSVFLDKLLRGFNTLIKMTIISSKIDLINNYINTELNRGTTLYKARGGYTKVDKEILMTIVGRSQYLKIKRFVNSIDDKAFVFINSTSEVIGEGFTREAAEE